VLGTARCASLDADSPLNFLFPRELLGRSRHRGGVRERARVRCLDGTRCSRDRRSGGRCADQHVIGSWCIERLDVKAKLSSVAIPLAHEKTCGVQPEFPRFVIRQLPLPREVDGVSSVRAAGRAARVDLGDARDGRRDGVRRVGVVGVERDLRGAFPVLRLEPPRPDVVLRPGLSRHGASGQRHGHRRQQSGDACATSCHHSTSSFHVNRWVTLENGPWSPAARLRASWSTPGNRRGGPRLVSLVAVYSTTAEPSSSRPTTVASMPSVAPVRPARL
jgi:hypothetical protein